MNVIGQSFEEGYVKHATLGPINFIACQYVSQGVPIQYKFDEQVKLLNTLLMAIDNLLIITTCK